ncbi:2-polyprenyl-6-methoxyphenol hydroxylase-like FAD-dependent oxidoreductase [Arthrobacter pigmenti]|uniref:2-polyprenyl-6-methoxyphenol hydroxylase-like FAD-dependent oxidoreductase n=1 Tax=Arthrobacter pigmenti TaxID=271432 RepID=A0A846RK90_9MICC|nr:NAD(P)/FAD-dependent oxidoreductase [Arthrobacter pigmenti]NJC23728.1 2-polyprenyl-6-methoxyphenol hydroxylase-like FAD-dependent oxidoreductase [Arthrobacter pigmenti]
MRILIVGAGTAGLALAGLLARRGEAAVVVDRRPHDADLGYAIALWPHGSRVFHALGVHEEFVAASEPMESYTGRDGSGRTLFSSAMPESIGAFGHLGIIPREDLLTLLRKPLTSSIDVRDGVGIASLWQSVHEVEVAFDDGTTGTFDLVVGADGIHSRVRDLTIGRVPDRHTGWGCYVWWADPSLTPPGATTERWAAGSFLGTYPCRDRLCVIAGAPLDTLQSRGRSTRVASLLTEHGAPELVDGLPPENEPLYLWPMADVRAPKWVKGRVALLGDAAAAFLPTAGIGASMALESAAVLADELSRTDAGYLPNALDLYVRRRRQRVEAAQNQSRRLARLMFVRSARLAAVRDKALLLATMEQMVGPLIKDLREPI